MLWIQMGGKIREFSNESERRIHSQIYLENIYIFYKEKEKQYEITYNAYSIETLANYCSCYFN